MRRRPKTRTTPSPTQTVAMVALADNVKLLESQSESSINGENGALLTRITNPYTFTGRRFDHETGLYYYRARYYDAKLGRFLSRAPIGFEGSKWNLYAYVSNSPLILSDPYGLAAGEGGEGADGDSCCKDKDKDKVEISCTPVKKWGITFGQHCAVVVTSADGSSATRYDGGGEGSVDPATGRPVPSRTEVDPANPHRKGAAVYETEGSDCETAECIENSFKNTKQLPYNRLGPNSNTYARELIKSCGVSMPKVDFMNPLDGEFREVLQTPADAVGWDGPGY